MRNKQLLRYSLASLSVMGAAFGVFLMACGDDDNTVTPNPTNEAGTNNEGGNNPTDGGGGTDAPIEAAPSKPNAKLQLVNAATDFGPDSTSGGLRICYGIGPTEAAAQIAGIPPLPDQKSGAAPFPGVFIGTGGSVQGTGVDLSKLVIIPYVMNAQRLAGKGLVRPDAGAGPGASCTDILGNADAGAGMIPGLDYWKLATIPLGTLAQEKSYILVLTGCTANVDAGTTGICGADWVAGPPGNGNLKVTVHEVDIATQPAADKIGTQFIQASKPAEFYLANLAGGALQVVPGYMGNGAQPNTFKGVTGDGGPGTAGVAYNSKSDLVQVTGVTVGTDSFTFNPNGAQYAFTLAQIQQLSYGATVPDGGAYRNGANFTFIAVGDPNPANQPPTIGGNFNTKFGHIIALPNNPVQDTFKPNQ